MLYEILYKQLFRTFDINILKQLCEIDIRFLQDNLNDAERELDYNIFFRNLCDYINNSSVDCIILVIDFLIKNTVHGNILFRETMNMSDIALSIEIHSFDKFIIFCKFIKNCDKDLRKHVIDNIFQTTHDYNICKYILNNYEELTNSYLVFDDLIYFRNNNELCEKKLAIFMIKYGMLLNKLYKNIKISETISETIYQRSRLHRYSSEGVNVIYTVCNFNSFITPNKYHTTIIKKLNEYKYNNMYVINYKLCLGCFINNTINKYYL